MNTELRRRAYLDAMQVVSWLPRVELPFAAPSRPELLQCLDEAQTPPSVEPALALPAAAQSQAAPLARDTAVERPRIELPRTETAIQARDTQPDQAPVRQRKQRPPAPRFALQLLRAGACALLVELPTGEPFQRRDPAYLLLKDLLRAAALPDSPQLIGEPVRWPLLASGNMDQGPEAALDFVRSFVAARLEEQEPCACLWLIGLPAMRFAADADATAYYSQLQPDGLGSCWALPGLELLMEQPQRKRELWRSMQGMRSCWMEV